MLCCIGTLLNISFCFLLPFPCYRYGLICTYVLVLILLTIQPILFSDWEAVGDEAAASERSRFTRHKSRFITAVPNGDAEFESMMNDIILTW